MLYIQVIEGRKKAKIIQGKAVPTIPTVTTKSVKVCEKQFKQVVESWVFEYYQRPHSCSLDYNLCKFECKCNNNNINCICKVPKNIKIISKLSKEQYDKLDLPIDRQVN